MKAYKLSFRLVLLVLGLFTSAVHAEGPWLTEISSAVKEAEKHNKPILVEFTGSDWCPPCKMMEKKVFSQKEFLSKAAKDYVLVKIDIPHSNPELSEKNKAVLAEHNVNSVPTVLLLRSNGKEFHRFPATQNDSVSAFLAHIQDQKKRLSLQ